MAEPFLIRTADLRRRLERLLGLPDPSAKRLNLREFAQAVRYRLTGSRFEQAFAYYQHAKRLFPRRYQELARKEPLRVLVIGDRKSTRLNSSHVRISYAVVCLKKKRDVAVSVH